MLAVNYTYARDNFKDCCDSATNDCNPVIITRKDNKNVVLISLEEYNNLQENFYIMSDKKDYDRLLESKKQIEKGRHKIRELIEVDDE